MKKREKVIAALCVIVLGISVMVWYRNVHRFDILYEICSNPDDIETIELIVKRDTITFDTYVIKDHDNIDTWCKTLNQTVIEKHKSYNAYKETILNEEYTFIVQPKDMQHSYALTFPIGRVVKRTPETEILTSAYIANDKPYLDAWVESIQEHYEPELQ